MASEKAIVLSSGGLNSAVITALATKEGPVAALHVRYGHRAAEREAELFEKQCEHFNVRERMVIDMPHFADMEASARVCRKRQIEDAISLSNAESNCYVPGLISALMSAAGCFAHRCGATRIYLGVSENLGPPAPKTSAIYPDYAREYIQLCDHLLTVAGGKRAIRLETPLLELSRAEIVKLGRRLDVPFELTWSCLSSGSQSCGACVGCATRSRGFLDAATPDPILLQTTAR
ncbi:MAG TPA: 7-cyano-7-deazaguanine synthase [Phycisphaerae bacterium]|nr:7-cyano-7-deazaguanine synthase [Phycisphaerae bacterium]